MEEAQALLLENFRVGKGNPSACAQWLTEMARNLLAPIPFREVFVILALFLPHFFPRVRTPCGHGAQVIVEGRKEQSDGGEKNKDNQHNPKTKQNTAHRPSLHHHVVFPLC